MEDLSPDPYVSNSFKEARDHLKTLQPESFYRWGFNLYRTTYDNQPLWDRYVSNLNHQINDTFSYQSEADRQTLQAIFRLNIIEGPDLEGASILEVRDRFTSWVSTLPSEADLQRDLPHVNDRDHVLFTYPLYVDAECLQSLQDKEDATSMGAEETPTVFIKAIDGSLEYPSSEDEWDDAADEFEEENGSDDDGDSEEEKKWMYVSCEDILNYWEPMSLGFNWEIQYGLCRWPQKRPWQEGIAYM
ncbi:uncharacterized protein LY79DRAFT_560875 [Colletotrichum navitas]|uniref:Uncharacterized protein n=1 Tax=Colletotrichum navitas TaxID=681940 RepID=A0AAD8PUP7_9PEZI|nr:uncharacterized protein LY79DRAFT_560875 [Colletotrichum navitas]KAK1580587.1 hypothetical protein LY79DRAFT_560875 [Colletotrichum navitas]